MKMKSILVLGALFSLLVLQSCASEDTTYTDDSSSTDSDSDTTSGNSDVDAATDTDCDSLTGIERIICLADLLKATMTDSQLNELQLSYSVSYAQTWSNLPGSQGRYGILLGDMDDEQIAYAKAILETASGTVVDEGWDEIVQTLNADDYLGENGGGSTYSSDNYYLAFLGTPALSGTFEIQFGGHHLAFANTYIDGVLVGATPSFRAIEPFAEFTINGTTNQPLIQEKDALSAMLTSLSSSELATAKLSASYNDLIAGPQNDNSFPNTASGIAASALTSAQQDLILAAIATYADDISDDEAAAIMTTYTSELDDTYISYSGNTSLTSRGDYVRIDGPSVWIEYSCQNGVNLSATHPHSVWRDKTYDYGGN